MLVLTRKVNQKIRIGSDIWITVIRVQGRSVRLGIEAPEDVSILRAELQPLPEPGTMQDQPEPGTTAEEADPPLPGGEVSRDDGPPQALGLAWQGGQTEAGSAVGGLCPGRLKATLGQECLCFSRG